MCGPIAFVLPLDRKSKSRRFWQILLYHTGRIFTYSLIGLLFGFLGRGLYLFGLQQKISILTGVLMIGAVILAALSVKTSSFTNPLYRSISKLKNKLGTALKKKSPDTFLTIGFLNGFLPCGLVYMAVFGAVAAGDFINGSLYMILFGLGTVPLMTTAVYFGNFLTLRLRQRIRKIIPVFVFVIGVLFILRGMGLGIPYVSPKPVTKEINTEVECHSVAGSADFNKYNS